MFEESNKYLVVLTILTCFFILVIIRKYVIQQGGGKHAESFIQEPPFIIKRNENTYDEFTSKVYDLIFHPEKDSNYVVKNVFKLTEPATSFTKILDIGCGTGELLNSLNNDGFDNVFGLEKSVSMAHECLEKYPYLKLKLGDAAQDTMLYDKSTFTHIFCIGMTIYEVKDKIAFFRNCYFWLKPNSFLILHLVNRDKFSAVIPCESKPLLLMKSKINNDNNKSIGIIANNYTNERIVNTAVDFEKFKYTSSYDFSKKEIVTFTETFLDVASSKIRKNERELYMPNEMENILYDAQYCGFIVTSQTSYSSFNGDENQFLFILERPN
jgi:SAM-dependent methyltransferase